MEKRYNALTLDFSTENSIQLDASLSRSVISKEILRFTVVFCVNAPLDFLT